MTSIVEEVIRYASKGIKQVQIANALGADESYVSQLVNDPEIAKRIQEAAGAQSEKNNTFDDAVESAEELALSNIVRRLPMADFDKSLRALTALNKLSKRRDTSRPTAVSQGVVVQLALPERYVPKFVTNSRSEIVEVEGRTMVSAQASQLPKLFHEKLGREVEKEVVQLSEEKSSRAQQMIAGIGGPVRRKKGADIDIADLV